MKKITAGMALEDLTLDEQTLAFIQQQGITHIEFRVKSLDSDAPMYNIKARRTLRNQIREHRLKASVHACAGVNLAEKVGRLRQMCIDLHFEQLEFCDDIGAEWLTFHAGTCGFSQNSAKKLERLQLCRDALGTMLSRCSDFKARLCLENVERRPLGGGKCYLGDRPEELHALFKDLPALSYVFDVGHASIGTEMAPEALLEPFVTRLLGFHVHANDGQSDHHAALSKVWVDARLSSILRLLDLSTEGLPLIIEHGSDLASVAQSLAVLRSVECDGQWT